jgi:hypothetical protein
MKNILFTIMFLSSVCLFGQVQDFNEIPKDISEHLDKMGVDNFPTLNDCECKYLNFNYQKNKTTFDFCGKKIYFLRGNIGTIKSTKIEYFDRLKYFVYQKGFLPSDSSQLIIFNEDEVKKTGYDAVIISRSKKKLTKKEVIKQLKK